MKDDRILSPRNRAVEILMALIVAQFALLPMPVLAQGTVLDAMIDEVPCIAGKGEVPMQVIPASVPIAAIPLMDPSIGPYLGINPRLASQLESNQVWFDYISACFRVANAIDYDARDFGNPQNAFDADCIAIDYMRNIGLFAGSRDSYEFLDEFRFRSASAFDQQIFGSYMSFEVRANNLGGCF